MIGQVVAGLFWSAFTVTLWRLWRAQRAEEADARAFADRCRARAAMGRVCDDCREATR